LGILFAIGYFLFTKVCLHANRILSDIYIYSVGGDGGRDDSGIMDLFYIDSNSFGGIFLYSSMYSLYGKL
jgi:hypothetical protein